MANKLTKKQRGFVNSYADTGNATLAVKENYDVDPDDDNTAAVMGSTLLSKDKVVEALKELGFDSNNAKRVVGEILNNHLAEESSRLRAASLIFDVNGDKAPEKVIYLNIEAKPNDAIRELANGLLNRQRE